MPGCKKKRVVTALPPLATDTSAVVFLSSLEGYVAPCGCTSNPLGGIDRFAQVFLDIKQHVHNNITLIDTGNLLFDSPTRHAADLCQDNARIDLLLSTLSYLGLKNTVINTYDNSRGDAYRDKIYQKYNLSPLPPNASFIIAQKNYNIAVININKNTNKQEIHTLITNNTKQKNIKAVIIISNLSSDQNKQIFNNLSTVDIIIQTGVSTTTPTTPTTPLRLGQNGPLLLEGGRQGQFATVLFFQNLTSRTTNFLELDQRNRLLSEQFELVSARLSALKAQLEKAPASRKNFLQERIKISQKEYENLEKKKSVAIEPLKVPSIIFEAIALTKKSDPEPGVKAQLERYEKDIPKLVAECEATIECPAPDPKAATYVGVQTCKNCHMPAYEVWQKAVVTGIGKDEEGKEFKRTVGHSKAWATLVDAGKDSDRSCIGCHSIGFMKPGGYCKASDVDFRKDVQCESCHGAGSLHAQSGDKKLIARQVSEETCRGCHHVPHIPSFDSFNYDRDVMKILGPGHGENLLKELKHKAASVK